MLLFIHHLGSFIAKDGIEIRDIIELQSHNRAFPAILYPELSPVVPLRGAHGTLGRECFPASREYSGTEWPEETDCIQLSEFPPFRCKA